MRVVSFSVPAWFPSYEEPDGPPAQHEAQPCEALLTEQESAVFLCLATGASNRELAGELQLSVSTVKFHVVNIRAKLGGISRLQACLLAALAREGSRPAHGPPGEHAPAESGPADRGPHESGTLESGTLESGTLDIDGGLSAAGGAAVPR
ncbi:response regulator transcription factor [Streptomyces erythrochromogenes]|uniref:response regulator transcription factor n=1 Tax=Streptomyces erythrochromogenes TaxID=285574 RepID=UPI002255DDF2|nr:helix-turn-helix transcriptional regulator [Streptomyces erythrochromogenes]MCX5585162.1 helix-turn-helix transcriptional regulator [Streptomyces erythrochromogenes]